MNKKIVLSTVSFSILSAIFLTASLFFFKDIYCDGGWYSYPALAVSRGGSPVEHHMPHDILMDIAGITSSFQHVTGSTLRVPYTATWLKHMPKTIFSLKLLSFLEFLLFLLVFYLLMYRISKNHIISLLLFSLLLNNKRIIELVTTDFRPDIIMAALTCLCLLFFLMEKQKIGFPLGTLTAFLLLFFHLTAPIPFLTIICLFSLQALYKKEIGLKYCSGYALVAIVGLTLFIFRQKILGFFLFPSELDNHISSIVASQKERIGAQPLPYIIDTWHQGFAFLLQKEVSRWKTYFWPYNLAELLSITGATGLFVWRLICSHKNNKLGISILLTLIAGGISLFLFDPHPTWRHGILLTPFIFLFMAYSFKINSLVDQKALAILVICVWITAIQSLYYSGNQALAGFQGGYNIKTAQNTCNTVLHDRTKKYILVGPTELWPFINSETNAIIIDIRNGKQFGQIESVIDDIDYIFINRDLKNWKFEQNFLAYFPEYKLKTIHELSGKNVLLKVLSLEKKFKESNLSKKADSFMASKI